MRRRAGQSVFRYVRRERIALLRRLRWQVAVMVFVFATVAVGFNAWPGMPAWSGGFVTGLFVASIFGMVNDVFAVFGFSTIRMGGDAERRTSQQLHRLGRGWAVLDDVRFEYWNVDHVVVGPDRVLAIETKWLGPRRDLGRACLEAADQARRGARKIRLLLQSEGAARQVTPVVMLWGPGAAGEISPASCHEDVEVVRGLESREWRVRLRCAVRAGQVADRVAHQIISQYITRFKGSTGELAGSPSSGPRTT